MTKNTPNTGQAGKTPGEILENKLLQRCGVNIPPHIAVEIVQILTADAVREKDERIKVLEEALEFYADPDTYFALAILPDPPCGEFIHDFSDTKDCHGFDTFKPGKRARAALTSPSSGKGKP